jgi:hypothetical protein
MIGYIYCTVTDDGCYYIGQHKKSSWDSSYYGSGKLLRGKTVSDCYQIDSADTLSELNSKEIHWISLCAEKHKRKCLNLSRGGSGYYFFYVNIKTMEATSDIDYVASLIGCSRGTVAKWINRMDGSFKALDSFKGKKLKKYHKTLMYEWVAMSPSDYLRSKALHR